MASSTKLVLLDTNFILSCYRFRIYLEEIDRLVDEVHEIVVPTNVLEELNRLTLTGKDEEARKTMLKVLEPYPPLPLEGKVDTSLLEYAREHDCIICTNDKPLRKVLRKMGIRTIFVRARSYLRME
jgi:rRNA-processing protein FCF1